MSEKQFARIVVEDIKTGGVLASVTVEKWLADRLEADPELMAQFQRDFFERARKGLDAMMQEFIIPGASSIHPRGLIDE